MKLLYTFFFALFMFSFTANAQLAVGNINNTGHGTKIKDLTNEEFNNFKNTTTIFTLPYSTQEDIQAYKKVIEEVWTITPFEIVPIENIASYMDDPKYSIFSFFLFTVDVHNADGRRTASHMHVFYQLHMPIMVKKKQKDLQLAQMYIFRSHFQNEEESEDFAQKTFSERHTSYFKFNSKTDRYADFILEAVYTRDFLNNFNPSFLKVYLNEINELLSKRETRNPFTSIEDSQQLSSLKTDTLYAPDYLLRQRAKMSYAEKKSLNKSDVSKYYPYPIKFLPVEELDLMIRNSTKPIKYLIYTHSSTAKFITVCDSGTNKMIFSNYVPAQYNFNLKDFRRITKAIK